MSPGLVAAALLAVGAVVVGAIWRAQRDVEPTPVSTSASVAGPSAKASGGSAFPWARASGVDDAQQVAAQQLEAASAAAKEVGAQPLTGRVAQRPPFVSIVEWSMLQSVAERSPNPDQTLTRLVNNLRFMKQLDLWRSLAQSTDTAQRKSVAEYLLKDLPERVKNGDMDLAGAKQLQGELLVDVVANPEERARRAELEAQRLPAEPKEAASQPV